MKRLNLILLLFIVLPLSSIAQTVITYSYDEAGNRTARTSTAEVAVIYEPQTVQGINKLKSFSDQMALYDAGALCKISKTCYNAVYNEVCDLHRQMLNGSLLVGTSLTYDTHFLYIINTKQKRI